MRKVDVYAKNASFFVCSLIVCLPHFVLPDGFNKATWTLVLSVSPVGLV